MRKSVKIWLFTAAFAIVLGMILLGGVMTMVQWDFRKISTTKYETNEHEILEDFSNISVEADTSDIIFIVSENESCRVECYEEEKSTHSVTVEGDTLTIRLQNKKAWYDYIGINFGSSKITVSLPKAEYDALRIHSNTGDVAIPKEMTLKEAEISVSTGDVRYYATTEGHIKIKASTGDICAENISAGSMDLSVSTGKIAVSDIACVGDLRIAVSTGKSIMSDVRCQNLISTGSTGDITLKNVIATEKFSINRSTGHIKFDGCDAAEIVVKTDTGDVIGTLLSDKVFIPRTDTGDINVPKTVTGGVCEITTDTGDIRISLQKGGTNSEG